MSESIQNCLPNEELLGDHTVTEELAPNDEIQQIDTWENEGGFVTDLEHNTH